MAEEESTQGQRKQLARRELAPRSSVWSHFTSFRDGHGKKKARCKRCSQVLTASHGTSSLKKHAKICGAQEEEGAAAAVGASRSLAPPTCNPSGSGASKDTMPVMNKADEANRCLAQMIVFKGYDPAIVEDRYFRSFARYLNPEFVVPSRRVIEEICDGMLDLSWDVDLDQDTPNFSLSVGRAKTMGREVLYIACQQLIYDCFPSLSNKVAYAYEFASRDDYCHGPLSGLPEVSLELVASNIVSDIPESAGLFMMACEKTDVPFVRKLDERIKQALGSRMSKKPLCATFMDQVIHSIARCLLPDLDFTKRMYSTVNNLKLTRQGRQNVLKQRGLDDPWEYNEHWYSCYCSLEVLRKGCSSIIATEDFQVIGILCDVWGKLYRSIKRISDPHREQPTSHLCLAELFKLREALQSELESATVYFVDGLQKSIAALDEAIQDSYLVWSIPLAMDPRYKLEYIEFIFETAFGSEAAGGYVAKVKENIKDVYSNYDEGGCTVDTSAGSADRMQQAWNKRRRGQAKTDLDRYLQNTLVHEEDMNDTEDMNDIVYWWYHTGTVHYPKVVQMAFDALAMPTSSRLSSRQIAEVQSIIRGYFARPEEEEEEEDEEDDDDDDSDGNVDAMIQELNY